MSANPPGCTERDHDEAFGVAPGYEEFCEEFAAGDHDAGMRIARLILVVRRGHVPITKEVIMAQELVASLICDPGYLRNACEELGIMRHYDAALKQAWAEHSNPQT